MISGHVIANRPSFRPRPDELDGYLRTSTTRCEFHISENVLDLIASESEVAFPEETIGHLFGRPFRDQTGEYAIVSAATVSEKARRSRSYVESTLDDEIFAEMFLRRTFPTCEKLGWWHSHPFNMPRYSLTDRNTQAVSCPEEYQMGLLVCLIDRDIHVHAFQGPHSTRCTHVMKKRSWQVEESNVGY